MPSVRSRSTVWLIGAATAFSLLGDQTLYSTLPVFFDELGLRPIEVGIILSANRWIRLGTNELAHRLHGVGDHRWFFVAAVAIGAATTAVYATTPGFVVFVLARLVWGLCWSFIRHLGVLSVLAVTAGERVGHAAGRLGGISRIGSVGGLFGGALLVDRFGFGTALLILAALSTIAVPLAWVGFAPVGERPAEADDQRDGHLVAGFLGFAHGMVGPGLVMATLGAVLDEQLGNGSWLSPAALTGAILAVRFVLESGVAARLGSISDRLGVRVAATGAFCFGALALAVAALSSSLPLLIAAVLTFFASGTALAAALLGFTGRQGSRALARYVTANDLGAASGPIIGWIALGWFEQRTIGLGIGAATYALAAVVSHRALRPSSS
ncbi:MAG: MFS transporter [Acidimicrobiales bacterium]